MGGINMGKLICGGEGTPMYKSYKHEFFIFYNY